MNPIDTARADAGRVLEHLDGPLRVRAKDRGEYADPPAIEIPAHVRAATASPLCGCHRGAR